jgi:tetratricopeptide (TPR) repeat protein
VQYQKILEAAQRYYTKGNPEKALELLKRALTFRPNDAYAQKRISEIEQELQR